MRTYAIYRNGRASALRMTPAEALAWPGTPILAAEQQSRMDQPVQATLVPMNGEESGANPRAYGE